MCPQGGDSCSEKLGDSCTKTRRALLRGMASPGGGCGPESRRPAWLELTEQGGGARVGCLVRSLDFIPLAVAAIKVFQAVTGSSSVFRKQFGC